MLYYLFKKQHSGNGSRIWGGKLVTAWICRARSTDQLMREIDVYDSVCNTSFFPLPSKNFWVLVVGWFGFFFSLESAATDKSDQQRLQYESVFENWSANTGEKNKTFYRRRLLPFLLSCPNIMLCGKYSFNTNIAICVIRSILLFYFWESFPFLHGMDECLITIWYNCIFNHASHFLKLCVFNELLHLQIQIIAALNTGIISVTDSCTVGSLSQQKY